MPAVSTSNRMLLALKQDVGKPWSWPLEQVELQAGHEIVAAGGTPDFLHFPTSALLVLEQTAPDGLVAPVAMVGNDGVTGLATLLGGGSEPLHARVLQTGWAWRLPAKALRDDPDKASETLPAALHYLQSLTVQMSQAAFCRQHHSVEQNLSRWLLTALDRLPGDAVAISPPALARLIGFSSSAVDGAVATLVQGGAVVCEADRLQVRDRSVLEATACVCHALAAGDGHSPRS